MIEYTISIRRLPEAEGGGMLVDVPDLPGCMADGNTLDEALKNVADAIDEWIAAAEEMGRAVPEPDAEARFSGKWVQRVPKSLHRRLSFAANTERVSLNSLATSLLAEGLGRRGRAT